MTKIQEKRIADLEDEVDRLRGIIRTMSIVVECADLIPLRSPRVRRPAVHGAPES